MSFPIVKCDNAIFHQIIRFVKFYFLVIFTFFYSIRKFSYLILQFNFSTWYKKQKKWAGFELLISYELSQRQKFNQRVVDVDS